MTEKRDDDGVFISERSLCGKVFDPLCNDDWGWFTVKAVVDTGMVTCKTCLRMARWAGEEGVNGHQ